MLVDILWHITNTVCQISSRSALHFGFVNVEVQHILGVRHDVYVEHRPLSVRRKMETSY